MSLSRTIMPLAFVAALIAGCDAQPSPDSESPIATASAEDRSGLIGTFIGWDAIDDARGYAIITVHNNTTGEFTLECTVTVTSDFGDTGSGVMEPETLLPEQEVSVQVAINVGDGAGAINDGEVTDC